MDKSDLKDVFLCEFGLHVPYVANVLETVDASSLWEIVVAISRVWKNGGTIWTMGNGGSAATASHFAEDLALAGLNAISLSADVARLTALANDFGYATVFCKQLEVLANPDDLVFVLSVSGNSKNVVAVAKWAQDNGVLAAGFLGKDGGEVKNSLNCSVVIPSGDYGLVESVHLFLCHVISQFM